MQPDEELDLSTDPALLAERYREQRDTWHLKAQELEEQLAESTADVTKLVAERDRLQAQGTQLRHDLAMAEKLGEADEVRVRANAAMQAAGAAGVALLEFTDACEKKFGPRGRRG